VRRIHQRGGQRRGRELHGQLPRGDAAAPARVRGQRHPRGRRLRRERRDGDLLGLRLARRRAPRS
jgi:hypothetical protein